MESVIYSILAAIIGLGVLIVFHEFGHFLIAKLCGVGVLTFSVGFGPKLLVKKKGETEYALSAFPLGGYVKMVGEDPDEEVSTNRCFSGSLSSRQALASICCWQFCCYSLFFCFTGCRWSRLR
jgi:RIP metalloprotease RseP